MPVGVPEAIVGLKCPAMIRYENVSVPPRLGSSADAAATASNAAAELSVTKSFFISLSSPWVPGPVLTPGLASRRKQPRTRWYPRRSRISCQRRGACRHWGVPSRHRNPLAGWALGLGRLVRRKLIGCAGTGTIDAAYRGRSCLDIVDNSCCALLRRGVFALYRRNGQRQKGRFKEVPAARKTIETRVNPVVRKSE